jgi:plastocyanin
MNRSRTASKPQMGCAQLIAALAALLLGAAELRADASYTLELRDTRGAPLEHAVLALYAADAPALPASPAGEPPAAVMDQRGHQFAPHVLAVRVGTAVDFPNSDRTRHHVYSFSPAKRFELKLYKGVPAQPVLFDRAGPVVLGCNIHDQMLGYIYVVQTPLFATSGADGRVSLHGLAPGRYRAQLWHPGLLEQGPHALGELELAEGEALSASAQLEISSSPPLKPEQSELERRFKRQGAP